MHCALVHRRTHCGAERRILANRNLSTLNDLILHQSISTTPDVAMP